MKRICAKVVLLGCFLVPPSILAGDFGSTSETVLTLEQAGSIHKFFAQFGKDYVPPVPAVALLEAAGGDLVIVDRDIRGTHITVQWDSANGILDVWKNGEWVNDLDVTFDDRIVFAGVYQSRTQAETGRTARVATLTGSIVAGPEGTLIVDIGNFRGMIQPGEGGIATDGPLPADSNMSSCKCFGLGPASKTCSDENCDVGLSCGKNRACRWTSPAV